MIRNDRVRVKASGQLGQVISSSGSTVIVQLDGPILETVGDDGETVKFQTVGDVVAMPDEWLEIVEG